MPFSDKLKAAQKELSESKIWRINANPPLFVILRKLGFNFRPMHYNTFTANFLTTALIFGGLWTVTMGFGTWDPQNMSVQTLIITSGFAGLFFGVLGAFYYQHSAKKYNLSKWEQL